MVQVRLQQSDSGLAKTAAALRGQQWAAVLLGWQLAVLQRPSLLQELPVRAGLREVASRRALLRRLLLAAVAVLLPLLLRPLQVVAAASAALCQATSGSGLATALQVAAAAGASAAMQQAGLQQPKRTLCQAAAPRCQPRGR